jgi:hypothetical protein
MNNADSQLEVLRRDLIAAGLDPTGLDLAMLVGIRVETEKIIAGHRDEPEYAAATPAFNPPQEPSQRSFVDDPT